MTFVRSIALGLIIPLFAGPSYAECEFCAPSVTFSSALSECYFEVFEDEFRAATDSGLPFHIVNLGACAATKDRAPSPMAQPKRAVPVDELDVTFLIEPDTMTCLRDRLVERDATTQPFVTVDLVGECTSDGS